MRPLRFFYSKKHEGGFIYTKKKEEGEEGDSVISGN
jgi:hypothetical protein